jgi:hypothetical protein
VPTERAAFRRIVTEADDPRPAIAVARGALAGAVATILIASSSLEPRAAFLGDPMMNTKTIVVMTAVASATVPALAVGDYADAVIASGPSAYWRFETATSFSVPNSVSGSPAGTASGGIEFGQPSASASLGASVRFVSGGIRIPNTLAVRPSAAYTVELWARNESSGFGFLLSAGRDIDVGSFKFVMRPSFPDCTLVSGVNDYVYGYWRVPTGASTMEWHHYTFTWDRERNFARMYVDGILTSDEPFSIAFTSSQADMIIGFHDFPGYPFHYQGLCDEVAIYQRALTESEIRAHYCAAGIDSATCCPADLNQDSQVNGSDIAVLLGFWGPTGTAFPAADINEDGIVNGSDLAAVLTAWGPCAP